MRTAWPRTARLGVRLSALGARTAVFYEPDLVTREECPPTLRAFVRQRTRWNQGYLQTLCRGLLAAAAPAAAGSRRLHPGHAVRHGDRLAADPGRDRDRCGGLKAPDRRSRSSPFLPRCPWRPCSWRKVVGLGEFCREYGERRLGARLCAPGPWPAAVPGRAGLRRGTGRGPRGSRRPGLGEDGAPGPAYRTACPRGRWIGGGGRRTAPACGRPATCRSPGVRSRSAKKAQPAVSLPGVLKPLPAQHALAESLVGSHQLAEAQANAPAVKALIGSAEQSARHEYFAVRSVADVRPGGNGHAGSHSPSIDGLFGEIGAAPLWARLHDVMTPRTAPLPAGGNPPKRHRSEPRAAARERSRPPTSRRHAARRSHPSAGPARRRRSGRRNELAALAGIQFDEGTYISYSWAIQHGRLANYTYSYGHPPLGWLLIFFWIEAGGFFGHAVFSIDHGREFMLLVCLASCSLLYLLARRLGFSRVTTVAAVVLFALCPLGIFFHRAVLLDNPSLAFAIAAFALAWTPKHRLWAFVGSGVCFAMSVLCKETTIDLLPALLLAVFQNSDRRTRRYCLTLFLSSFLLTGGFYPLYATLKGELLPGKGHVSLVNYLAIQLFSRQSTGSVLNAHSQSHAIVAAWLQLDPWLLGLALAVVPIALARRTTRAIALAFLIQVVTVFRPGYLPNMYVIGMLPFAALMVPGSLEAIWRWAPWRRFPAVVWATRAAVVALACALVLVIAPRWDSGDRSAMTLRQDSVDRTAEQWVVEHLPRDKRVIVDDEFWIYLIDHGYNDQPMRGGFFSSTVISYWPLDYDPAVKKAFPQGWRDFDYIVVTQAIVDTLTNTPSAAEAINHSRVVASFGQGVQRVQIREIIVAGR